MTVAKNLKKTTRLVARATGQSYVQALRLHTAQGFPIVCAPTPLQEELEGAVLSKIGDLFPSTTDGSNHLFDLGKVAPTSNSLILGPVASALLPGLAVNLMPVLESPKESAELHGIPGLRVRPHPLGLSLFRHDLDAEIIIRGTTATEWELGHQSGLVEHHRLGTCLAARYPETWMRLEMDRYMNGLPEDPVWQSVLLRRIGLIAELSPRSVSSYWSHGQGVVVEVQQPRSDAAVVEQFIRDFTSPRLSPEVVYVPEEDYPCRGGMSRSVQFGTPRSLHPLTIRFVHLPQF
ncbi:hypothetical protein J2T22_001647 [Pseudarthrobacter defluvii]|uniref:Uncharacterized protein n=1 Tax=Pseudarthrobacter defluvii TaxID=410837 RepID=A0ABT9UJ66_9MICC|nr:hypothetical protein [Pseudarthrobacter defluvii]MDQ0118469.1 hypothetical protein [Pseudarthrobacter defluvii]